MSKSIDRFLCYERRENYDCLDFACDAWRFLTDGQDNRLEELRDLRQNKSPLVPSMIKKFEKIPAPFGQCIVLMQRVDRESHIGVFYEHRILHLPLTYVRFELPSTVELYMNSVEYYR